MQKSKQKLIKIIITFIIASMLFPKIAYAQDEDDTIGGMLFEPILNVFTFIIDGGYNILSLTMLGDGNAVNINPLNSTQTTANMKYGIYMIVSNQVPILDANFITPSTSNATTKTIHDSVAKWFYQLRTLSVLLLLVILAYMGIRMMISSTGEDKAKYKKMFMDWVIAVAILASMHIIMVLLFTINNMIIDSLTSPRPDTLIRQIRETIVIKDSAGIVFGRFGDVVMYAVLVYLTLLFTVKYLKRVIYLAFLTLIAPLVTITYPMDKVKDGKSQAFNTWLKEYIFNFAIQPIDLMIYLILVSSAMDFIQDSLLYGILAISMIMPAEKFIGSLFNIKPKYGAKAMTTWMGFAIAAKVRDRLKKNVHNMDKKRATNKLAATKMKEQRQAITGQNNPSKARDIADKVGGMVSSVAGSIGGIATNAISVGTGAMTGLTKTIATGDFMNIGGNVLNSATAGLATSKYIKASSKLGASALNYKYQDLRLTRTAKKYGTTRPPSPPSPPTPPTPPSPPSPPSP